jgi:UDP-N-acetylglucosamine--N-acetylmuramyl-(pentapeptide) pyrophosphoryl-undecaprenol N-acetylglucosamine transferase
LGGIEEELTKDWHPVFDYRDGAGARENALVRLSRRACDGQRSAALIAEFRPDVALVTGGYVAAPVAWAARRADVPLLIYLPDLEPGLEIRMTSRLAQKIAVSFPEVARFFPGKAEVTGYPVRSELWDADRTAASPWRFVPTCRCCLFGGSRA